MKGRTLPELLLHLLHLLLLLLVWHFGDAVVMVSLSHGNDSLLLQSVFIVLVHALSLLSICFHAFNFFFSFSSPHILTFVGLLDMMMMIRESWRDVGAGGGREGAYSSASSLLSSSRRCFLLFL